MAAHEGLQELVKSSGPDEAAVDIVLLGVPHLVRFSRWAVVQQHKRLGNVNIYGYEPWPQPEVTFSWQLYLKYAHDLVQDLMRFCRTEDGKFRPIILMAHSIAGFLLKKCLIVVDIQKDRYRQLREAIKGVIFIGTPHCLLRERRDDLYIHACYILQFSNLRRKANGKAKHGQDLFTVCTQFDGIRGGMPVLSLHETRSTKVHKGFGISNHVVLVDGVLAQLEAPTRETILAVDSDHFNLPSLCVDLVGRGLDEDAFQKVIGMVRAAEVVAEKLPIPLDSLIGDFERSMHLPKLPCFAVNLARQRNKDFYGREDVLQRLEGQLLSQSQLAVLHGMGGVGKSEIALEFVHRHRASYDAIFWIQADDLSKMRQDFGWLAVTLGLSDGKQDAFTSRELVKAWLMNPIMSSNDSTKAKWLIVFDGADITGTLDEFQDLYGKGSIFVTSRDSEILSAFVDSPAPSSRAEDDVRTSAVIGLRLYNEEEAAIVLRKAVGLQMDEEDQVARDIARLLNGWPLAINQMAAFIRSQYLSLGEFYERYRDSGIRCDLQARGLNAAEEAGRDTMVSSLKLASLTPEATALLQVCAMLDADRIQEKLFPLPENADVNLEGFPRTLAEYEKARNNLLSTSLIQRNKSKQELWLHKVVQDTVRGQMSIEAFDLAFRTAALLVQKAWHAPSQAVRDNLRLWEPCAEMLPHVLYLQQLLNANPLSAVALKPCYPFTWLLCEVVCLQRNLGNTAGLKDTLDRALTLCAELRKKDQYELRGEIYHQLGSWANETNHPDECEDYNTRYLNMRLDAVKEGCLRDHRTAAAYNQYGTGQMMMKRYDQAVQAFQDSIDVYATLQSDEPCQDSLPKVNLANALWLMGHLSRAAEILDAGLLERENAFGYMDNHSFRTGRFYHTLGNVRWSQNRLPESETWHRRALKQYQSVLGNLHHRTADVRYRVAEHCLRGHDHVNAGILIDQALKSWKLDAASFKPEIARATWLKARLSGSAGNPEEKRELQRKAAELRRQLLTMEDRREPSELNDHDFDELVAFWSR